MIIFKKFLTQVFLGRTISTSCISFFSVKELFCCNLVKRRCKENAHFSEPSETDEEVCLFDCVFWFQVDTSTQLWHSGCFWQGRWHFHGWYCTSCVNAWELFVERGWWKASNLHSTRASAVVPTALLMATRREMASELRLWVPLCWFTLFSLPQMPNEMPETPMFL